MTAEVLISFSFEKFVSFSCFKKILTCASCLVELQVRLYVGLRLRH